MIAAHKGKHQVFPGDIAHDFQRVLDSLGTSDVKMHAPFYSEALFAVLRNARGHLNLLGVQVLASKLRQPIELALQRIIQPAVFIAEACC